MRTCKYTCMCALVCVHVCVCVRANICIHVTTHTHKHTPTHTPTHTHTRFHARKVRGRACGGPHAQTKKHIKNTYKKTATTAARGRACRRPHQQNVFPFFFSNSGKRACVWWAASADWCQKKTRRRLCGPLRCWHTRTSSSSSVWFRA